MNGVRIFVCGTRKVVERKPNDYRVVCATCDTGGTVHHDTKASAIDACVRDSGQVCRSCGAH